MNQQNSYKKAGLGEGELQSKDCGGRDRRIFGAYLTADIVYLVILRPVRDLIKNKNANQGGQHLRNDTGSSPLVSTDVYANSNSDNVVIPTDFTGLAWQDSHRGGVAFSGTQVSL